MYVFILFFVIFTILSGMAMLIFTLTASIIGKNIECITYTPLTENETEYGLRTLLFMYPNAVIHTPQNEKSNRLMAENTRVIVHQEI